MLTIITRKLMVFVLDFFKVLGNENRRRILKLLFGGEMHLNEIARKLDVSVPVVFKHVKVLERSDLIERQKLGNVHMLRLNTVHIETVRKIFDAVERAHVVKLGRGGTLLDALRQAPEIGLKKAKEGYFVESIDGKKGYFLFEVNGKIPNRSLEKIVLRKDSEISFYHLTPVLGKRFAVNLE